MNLVLDLTGPKYDAKETFSALRHLFEKWSRTAVNEITVTGFLRAPKTGLKTPYFEFTRFK